MASLCTETIPKEDDIILITADKDMYQCLSDRVIIWEPRTRNVITIAGFIKAYGINPDQWAEVKAIAGCGTDDVVGVRGVGEATAIAYIRGDLKPGKKLQAIQEAYRSGLVKQNRRLVRLPYRGCPVFELSTDEVTADKWATLANRLGMRSLAGHAPISGRAARRKPNGFICG
jgi:5'-3' exonuclease